MKMKIGYVVLMLMIAASVMAANLRPQHKITEGQPKLMLEQAIPQQFNDWRVLDLTAQLVNPEVQAAVNKVYAQTLSRTYTNAKGDVIMLSIAYGEDQSDSVGVHLPEGCYGGQGFNIGKVVRDKIATESLTIPVTKVIATKTNRIEPITYWLRTGEQLTYPGMDTKLARLQYGLTGHVPDGMLVRVSSLTRTTETDDIAHAYAIHARFIQDLISATPYTKRHTLIGQVIRPLS
jgi:EpsI family protein